MNVFTYGSLMFAPVWSRLVRGRYRSAQARLDGYRRLAVRGKSYPGLVREVGACCRGTVYFGVSARDAARLDAFEGSAYLRRTVRCRLDGSGAPLRADTYVFVDRERLEACDWDPQQFAAGDLAHFVASHWG
ncbi:MAG: gamma-glutamylcyclotransferase [Burkholderiales bacterium]|nr:MAG: gamma-glutamylcyclotransferase [Burkholderiales bacterium]